MAIHDYQCELGAVAFRDERSHSSCTQPLWTQPRDYVVSILAFDLKCCNLVSCKQCALSGRAGASGCTTGRGASDRCGSGRQIKMIDQHWLPPHRRQRFVIDSLKLRARFRFDKWKGVRDDARPLPIRRRKNASRSAPRNSSRHNPRGDSMEKRQAARPLRLIEKRQWGDMKSTCHRRRRECRATV